MTSSSRAKENLRRWRHDPKAFVREQFQEEPDEWQAEALDAIGSGTAPRVAMQACKGPGKSKLLAWVIWWFLVTRPHANIVAVSITWDNLQAGLWKELALLRNKSKLITQAFEQTTERIFEKKNKKTWFCDARAFPGGSDPQAQKATLAGLHNKHVMIVLDESGDMPPGVLVAAEAIFANDVEALLLQAGNPTSMSGALYESCVRRSHRYKVVRITGDPDDPRRSKRISVEWARQLIDDYTRQNPYVMVNVLGMFPPVAADKLLGQADIDRAINRHAMPPAFEQEARVWGLDIARQGDDSSPLTKRQGVMAWAARVWRTPDLMLLADQVAQEIEEAARKDQAPHAVFIGVAGMGWGVYDRLNQLGYSSICTAIDEGGGALKPQYGNKRAEMWCEGAEWVKRHGCLPSEDIELHADLLAPSYDYNTRGKRTTMILEPNDKIKAALGRSPDKGTSLMLTFAAPVAPPKLRAMLAAHHAEDRSGFDPWNHLSGGN